MKHFEDFYPGEITELGAYEVSEGEMIEFARRYDPQVFHVDPVGAANSPLSGALTR